MATSTRSERVSGIALPLFGLLLILLAPPLAVVGYLGFTHQDVFTLGNWGLMVLVAFLAALCASSGAVIIGVQERYRLRHATSAHWLREGLAVASIAVGLLELAIIAGEACLLFWAMGAMD
jgi:hypothetical protein